jgi:hypothetical protein
MVVEKGFASASICPSPDSAVLISDPFLRKSGLGQDRATVSETHTLRQHIDTLSLLLGAKLIGVELMPESADRGKTARPSGAVPSGAAD